MESPEGTEGEGDKDKDKAMAPALKWRTRVEELEGLLAHERSLSKLQRETAREQERVLRVINESLQREHLVLVGAHPPGEARRILQEADAAARLPALQKELHELSFQLGMLGPKALELDKEVAALKDERRRLQARHDELLAGCGAIGKLVNSVLTS